MTAAAGFDRMLRLSLLRPVRRFDGEGCQLLSGEGRVLGLVVTTL